MVSEIGVNTNWE